MAPPSNRSFLKNEEINKYIVLGAELLQQDGVLRAHISQGGGQDVCTETFAIWKQVHA
jgi:hypothetical protein